LFSQGRVRSRLFADNQRTKSKRLTRLSVQVDIREKLDKYQRFDITIKPFITLKGYS